MDVTSELEVFYRLSETEQRILRTAALMGATPLACAMFEVYFPELPPERLKRIREEITALKY